EREVYGVPDVRRTPCEQTGCCKRNRMTALIIFCAKYLFVAIPLILVWVFWQVSPVDRRTLLLRGVIVLIVAVVLAKGGGALYNEPRPFVVQHVTPLVPHDADNGFPSDHTLLCFACAFLLLPFSPRAVGPALLIAATVGMARIASLLHSPLDVIASILMAAVANIIAWKAVRNPPPANQNADPTHCA
ncbi:MAG: bcrC1, partial [Chthonomonadaceae bacterium]|nr:bcrC1 [Chthonomonadaceae bacterium]